MGSHFTITPDVVVQIIQAQVVVYLVGTWAALSIAEIVVYHGLELCRAAREWREAQK